MPIYLQQFISQSGIASRRQAIELIKAGKVKINNKLAEPGIKVNPQKDKIKINNRLIKPKSKKVYYLVNKPIGYVCTLKDKFAKKKIVDLVPKNPKVWPVGRLDKDSHGLIILTNDGELTHKLTHPSFKHEKEYILVLNKPVTADLLSKLKKGVKLEEGIAKADKLKKLSTKKLSLTLHQGWKRQIRRMMQKCGYKAVDLERIRIGEWRLDKLSSGKYKQIKISKL